MDFLQAIILGVIQGITEWLPVSSKGNVSAIAQLMGLPVRDAFSFAVLLHIGTLVAAAVYFRKEIIALLKIKDKKLTKFIAIALVCTGITALPSYLLLRTILEKESIILFGLTVHTQTIFMMLLGIFLIITGLLQRRKKTFDEKNYSGKNAAILGLGQGLTVMPGMSRSGTTVAILLFEKFSPEEAFKISFLLSVPAVLLGELSFGILEGPQLSTGLFYGIIAAAIAGFISIHALLKLAEKINFSKFCIALGILYLAIAAIAVALPFIA